MPAPYCTTKKQEFEMPDGTIKTIEDTHQWKYIVLTADPDYRVLAKCSTKYISEMQYAYYRRLWDRDGGESIPIWIIPRKSYTYVYDEPGYQQPEPDINPNWKKIGD